MKDFLGRNIYYDPHLTEDKYFFGGFFNLADNNITNVFREIEEKLSLKVRPKAIVDKINDYYNDTVSHADWDRRVNLLAEYFPIVTLMNHRVNNLPIRESFREELLLWTKYIENLRNYYTHHFHADLEYNPKIFEMLDRFIPTIVKREQMQRSKKEEYIKLKFNFEKELSHLTEKEREIKVQSSFNHIIDNTGQLNSLYKAQINEKLSRSGLLFLLTSALSKKESVLLLSNVEGFKATNDLPYMATRWVFTHLCFKGLKKVIRSHYSDEAMLMQIIDELSKCPHELYERLGEKDKEEFLYDMNEYYKDNFDNIYDDTLVSHPIIRKRYLDREKRRKFIYFALRFLDTCVEFPSLRFQVHAGNFIHHEGTKTLKGTQLESDRIIKERINFFAKLDDVAHAKAKYFEGRTVQPTEDTMDVDEDMSSESKHRINENISTNDWELFPFPSYNLMGNNIPIYIKLKDEVNFSPERKSGKPSKNEIINMVFKDIEDLHYGKPTMLLSIHELPALLHEVLVKRKTGKDIEAHLKRKIFAHIDLIKNPHGCSDATDTLPKSLLQNNDEDRFDINKLKRKIISDKEYIQEKRDWLNDKRKFAEENKKKHIFTKSDIGNIGMELADELKLYFSQSTKETWKGYQHAELQFLITFYDAKRNELEQLLKSAFGKTNDYREQRIMNLIKKNSNLESFYNGYLDIKSKFVKFIERKVKDLHDPEKAQYAIQTIFSIYDQRLFTLKSQKRIQKELLSHPINLSRGVFDDKPAVIPGKNIQIEPELFADWLVHAKAHFDDMQTFYSYNVYKNDNETNNKYFDALKTISKIKVEDVYLKHIADYLFKKITSNSYSFVLIDIFKTQAERESQRAAANQQKERQKGDTSDNIHNVDFVWDIPISMSIEEGRITADKIKLKEVGKFRDLALKSQLKTIISYDDRQWTREEIIEELESYEKVRRESLLKKVQILEKDILSGFLGDTNLTSDNHPSVMTQKGYPNFKKYVLYGWLKDKIDSKERVLLDKEIQNLSFDQAKSLSEIGRLAYIAIFIRNKFAHNHLPNADILSLAQATINQSNEKESYAEMWDHIFSECITKIQAILDT
jgi:hypothetical protein